MDVYYKRGDEHNETDWHINTVEVNGAKLHKIQLSGGTLTNVPEFLCSWRNSQISQIFQLMLKLIA